MCKCSGKSWCHCQSSGNIVCRVPKGMHMVRYLLTIPLLERLICRPSKPVTKLSFCRSAGEQKKLSIWRRKANCYVLLYFSNIFRMSFECFSGINKKKSGTNKLSCTFIMKRRIFCNPKLQEAKHVKFLPDIVKFLLWAAWYPLCNGQLSQISLLQGECFGRMSSSSFKELCCLTATFVPRCKRNAQFCLLIIFYL